MCFLCRRSLDGWEEDDDPVTEHLKHSPHCGWAINVSIEQRSEQEIRSEEDPLNEKMMDARRETFADRWPHESKKGWTCKTEKASNPTAGISMKSMLNHSICRWSRRDGFTVQHRKVMTS